MDRSASSLSLTWPPTTMLSMFFEQKIVTFFLGEEEWWVWTLMHNNVAQICSVKKVKRMNQLVVRAALLLLYTEFSFSMYLYVLISGYLGSR